MTETRKRYLGDGVYAEFDGYHIKLTGNANSQHNEIYLEPMVLLELLDWMEDKDLIDRKRREKR